MTDSAAPSLLLVDDDPIVIQTMARVLREMARLRFAPSAAEALRVATQEPPDLLLLDAELPDGSGLDVLRQLRAQPGLQDLAVIVVTSHREADTEEAYLEAGAQDFIGKPISPPVLKARVRTQLRLKTALDALRRQAVTDALTGCANRRALIDHLQREWSRAWRQQRPFALLMADVDHFKRYNDRYGHLQGDRTLVAVAEALRASAGRPGDCVARYGGEEFCVVLPDTDAEGARQVAAAVQQRLAALNLPHLDGEQGRVTLSIGMACHQPAAGDAPHPPPPLEQLLTLADERLYAAKQAGRNRVEAAPLVRR